MRTDALTTLLADFELFLQEQDLTPPNTRPHLVRWVRDFLLFTEEHHGGTFDQTLDHFLDVLGRRNGLQPWQIEHPGKPTPDEVKAFLTRLAMVDRVSASTQNQAFSALIYTHVVREFKTKARSPLDGIRPREPSSAV